MDAAKKTLELIEAHPYTRKLREEREAETLQVRTEAAERLARSKEEAARVLPELQAAEDAARAAVREHDKQRKDLEGAVARAAAARAVERLRLERETAAAERILLENYSEKIDEAITFFWERFEALRQKTPDSDKRIEGTNIFTEKKIFTVYSNYDAITAALRYIRAAMSELEAMKLTPAPDFARIEELRRGIPDTGEMQEYSSEKPFPRDPPTEIEKIRMDEQAGTTDYLLGKLNQKFKELMGRPRK
jgi:hypothetical protein